MAICNLTFFDINHVLPIKRTQCRPLRHTHIFRLFRATRNFNSLKRSLYPRRAAAPLGFTQTSSAGPGFAEDVTVSFALPYKCEFGQNLSLIGSIAALGNWIVDHSINMKWTEGNVWRTELSIPFGRVEVEYKYLVRNGDGRVATWKPGDNFQLHIPIAETQEPPQIIQIQDAWDNSSRQIEIALKTSRNGSDSEEKGSQEPKQLAITLAVEAEEAIADLKAIVEESSAILDSVNPTSPEALAADQAVALAARRATKLMHALRETKAKGVISE